MNAGSKFLVVAAILTSLPIIYRVAPGAAILVGIGLLVAAYVAVNGDRRR
jgi:hypothetical protein